MKKESKTGLARIKAMKVRESPVLSGVSGALSGKQVAAQLRAAYRKHLADKYR